MLQHRDPWNPWPRLSGFFLSTPADGSKPVDWGDASTSRAAAPPVLVRCFVRGADGVVESVAFPSASDVAA